jgi:hypothetical protein
MDHWIVGVMDKLKSTGFLIALLVFLTAFLTYWSTIAETTPFWDASEFISCGYILGVPHPPGAPLYILLARIFSMLPLAEDIALRINVLSAIFSALASMLAFLIIVRLLELWQGKGKSFEQRFIQYAGGVIGALAFTFSDTQWFNSVEAELYSGSLLLTALIFLLILKWTEQSGQPDADRTMLLIAYLAGLALGIHLLSILVLPAVFLIVYFQRNQLSWRSFARFTIGAAVAFGITYPVVVKQIPQMLASFSFMVIIAFFGAIILAVHAAIKKQKRHFVLALTSLLLVITGYSTYTTLFIRSQHDPVIDMNNPDNAERFVHYINREQYGDWPLWPRRASLWDYQIKEMYIRSFGWQYIGKGDSYDANRRIAETISLRGLWGLPFLMGLIGMAHHFRKDWRRAASILVLFLMTGLAIVFYLNQENPQPRERDYVYTGSFLAFAFMTAREISSRLTIHIISCKAVSATPFCLPMATTTPIRFGRCKRFMACGATSE